MEGRQGMVRRWAWTLPVQRVKVGAAVGCEVDVRRYAAGERIDPLGHIWDGRTLGSPPTQRRERRLAPAIFGRERRLAPAMLGRERRLAPAILGRERRLAPAMLGRAEPNQVSESALAALRSLWTIFSGTQQPGQLDDARTCSLIQQNRGRHGMKALREGVGMKALA